MINFLKMVSNFLNSWFEKEETPYIKLVIITAAIALAVWCAYHGVETFGLK